MNSERYRILPGSSDVASIDADPCIRRVRMRSSTAGSSVDCTFTSISFIHSKMAFLHPLVSVMRLQSSMRSRGSLYVHFRLK